MLDILIVNAQIVDGTGSGRYPGELGVKDGRIAHLRATGPAGATGPAAGTAEASTAGGDTAGAGAPAGSPQAVRVIDAAGHVVSPGFIDLHSHADFSIQASPAAVTQLVQGVTTALTGNCGSSTFPARSLEDIRRDNAHLDAGFTGEWTDAAGFFAALDETQPGMNIAVQVGLSSIRSYILGPGDVAPDDAQLAAMRREVAKAAEAGVHGFSSGLIYAPGSYSTPPEVAALVAEAASHDLLYSTHMRNESHSLLDSVREAIAAAEAGGARLEISHLKAMGPENYGKPAAALELIEAALARGVDVTADVYPYTASSTRLTSRLPGFAMDGGKDALLERLAESEVRARIAAGMAERFGRDIDPAGVVIASVGPQSGVGSYEWTVGLSLEQIGQRDGCSPQEAAMRVLQAHDAAVGIVNHAMDPADVARVLAHPLVSVASDGWTMNTERVGKPHPRSFGTFVTVLGHYVRETGLLTLEEAVRKMTSAPAARMGLVDRGVLEVGRVADVAVFDPDTVRQNATYDEPWQLATGVSTVLVGGNVAVDAGRVVPERFGQALRKNG